MKQADDKKTMRIMDIKSSAEEEKSADIEELADLK